MQNTGGGTISFTSVTCGAPFCVVPATVPSIGGGATANISVQANPAGLSAGFYFTELTIVSSAGTVEVPVTLLVQANPSLVLSPSGDEFSQPAGVVAAQPDTQFLVNISGASSATSSVSFTAQILPGAPWLSLTTTSGSSTASNPGLVSYKINGNASSLAAGTYYATIRVIPAASSTRRRISRWCSMYRGQVYSRRRAQVQQCVTLPVASFQYISNGACCTAAPL